MPKTRVRTRAKLTPKVIAFGAFLAVVLVAIVGVTVGLITRDAPAYTSSYTPPPAGGSPEDVPVDLTKVTKAMFIGDSLTRGVGATPEQAGFAYLTAQKLGVRPVVWGFGGTGYVNRGAGDAGNYAERFAHVGIFETPDLVVVQGSANDLNFAPNDIRANANAFVNILQQKFPRAQIVLMGPETIDLDQPASKLSDVSWAIREAAKDEGVRFVDPIGENWIDESNLWQNVQYQEAMVRRVTNAGHAYFSERLLADLRGDATP